MKKGETILFVIIGIVLISLVILIVYLNYESEVSDDAANIDSSPVVIYAQACLDETVKDGISFVSFQGGYYDDVMLSYYYLFKDIPYYWKDGISLVPEISLIEQELNDYLSDNFLDCINEFELFKESDLKINSEELVIENVKINDNDVSISINFPIQIKEGESVINVEKFKSIINSKLKVAYDSSVKIIEEQGKIGEEMPLGYISELALENGFKYDLVYVEEDEVMYALEFEGGDRSLVYVFIVGYNWGEEK